MQPGPEALRGIAASCLEYAKAATDEVERAALLTYATLYHDLAVTLEQLASISPDSVSTSEEPAQTPDPGEQT